MTVENCHVHILGFKRGWYRASRSVFFTGPPVVQTICQECTNPERQITIPTKLCTVSHNICDSSVLNLFHVSLLTYRILRSLLDIENLYNPVERHSAVLPLIYLSIVLIALLFIHCLQVGDQSSYCLTDRSDIGSAIVSSQLKKKKYARYVGGTLSPSSGKMKEHYSRAVGWNWSLILNSPFDQDDVVTSNRWKAQYRQQKKKGSKACRWNENLLLEEAVRFIANDWGEVWTLEQHLKKPDD